jgi:hypothetical protein
MYNFFILHVSHVIAYIYNIYKASVSPGSVQQIMPYFWYLLNWIKTNIAQTKIFLKSFCENNVHFTGFEIIMAENLPECVVMYFGGSLPTFLKRWKISKGSNLQDRNSNYSDRRVSEEENIEKVILCVRETWSHTRKIKHSLQFRFSSEYLGEERRNWRVASAESPALPTLFFECDEYFLRRSKQLAFHGIQDQST